MHIREARPGDVPEIRSILRHHAHSEGGIVPADDDELDQVLFGPRAVVHVAVAEDQETLAGLAMWYPTFSSWALRTGIWLEDLYVKTEYRKAGVGRDLMLYLRQQTRGRIDWDVSDGNERAHRFYQRLGAVHLDGFARYRWPAVTPETRPVD
jgi:GNAT superfamily N-acetyltransferase